MTQNFLTEKDFNLAIYAELTAAAIDVFNNYIICAPGQYTAADIAKELYIYTEKETVTVIDKFTGLSRQVQKEVIKERGFKPGKFQFKEGYNANDDRREIVVNSFSCVVTGFSVFDVLKRAAAAWNVPTSKKALFIRETETAPVAAVFDSPDNGTARQLKNSVAADQLRPVLSYVFADIRRRCLVASDGNIMTVAAAPSLAVAADVAENEMKEGYLIAPALLKNKTQIKIDANDIASNGAAAAEIYDGRFPNWFDVLNNDYYENGAVNLAGHWSQIKKVAAAFAKFTDLENNPVVMYAENYTNKLHLLTENYDGQKKEETITFEKEFNFNFVIAFNGAQLAKIERAENLYLRDTSRALVFTAPGLVSLLMPVLINDNSFNTLPFRSFKVQENGPRAAVLPIVNLGPAAVIETETAAPAAVESSVPAIVANDDTAAPAAADIQTAPAADDSERQPRAPRSKSLLDFTAQLSRLSSIADTWRPVRRDKNGENVYFCTCPYQYGLPIIKGDQKQYNVATDHINTARTIVAAYRKNIETATGRDFWDVNEKFAPAIYRGLTTANDDTPAPAADIETSETPAALVPDVAAPAADIETTANDTTPAPVAIVASDDSETPAALVPDVAAPAAADIETTANDETPAPVLVPVAFVDVCETPANDDTAAPGFGAAPVESSAPVVFWTPANDDSETPAAVLVPDIERETPANDDTPRAAVAYLIRRARRLAVAVAAAVAALLLLTVANDRPAPSLAAPAADIETAAPVLVPDVANDTTAAPVLSPATAANVAAPTMTPPTMEKRATAKKRQPRARRHRETAPAAVLVPVDTTANDTTARALLTVANDTTAAPVLAVDSARALAVDTLETVCEITAPTDSAAARVDTLETAGEITAPASIETTSTTANDDTAAPVVSTSDDDSESDTAAPADDDTANDDGTTAPTSGTATTATTGTPATMATPAPVSAPVAPVAPILIL